MILFYSDYCPHCRMLLDTIERHDSNKMIKIVSIEALKAKGQPIPPRITAVPALILLPSKDVLIGKAVFDYLLLPGKGKLLTALGASKQQAPSTTSPSNDPVAPANEPMAYSIASSGLSDAFSSIEEQDTPSYGLDDRSYAWATLDKEPESVAVFSNSPFQEETRMKKNLPDLDAIKSQRDMELTQNDLNTCQLLPPTATRI